MSSLTQFERCCKDTANERGIKALIKGLENARIFHSLGATTVNRKAF